MRARWARCFGIPNFVKIGQTVTKILRFFDFSGSRPPPFWIVKFAKFYWLMVSGWSRCISVPSFVKIGRSVAEILWLSNFQDGHRCHLGFLKLQKFYWLRGSKGSRVKTLQHTKFRQNRSVVCEDINIFDFSRWRPSAILDLFGAYLPAWWVCHRQHFCGPQFTQAPLCDAHTFSPHFTRCHTRRSAFYQWRALFFLVVKQTTKI